MSQFRYEQLSHLVRALLAHLPPFVMAIVRCAALRLPNRHRLH
jgi:hypothetical protein